MSTEVYPPEPLNYPLAIPKGDVAGQSSVNKFGRNTAVGTGGEDIWDAGGTWVAPTQARLHAIVSDSTADAPSASGSWEVQVYGLKTWSSAEHSEVLAMNGTTAVTTSASYVIIHRIVSTNHGVLPNKGVISCTADIDGTVTAQILAEQGQTQMAIYGIPSTQTAYMTGFYCSILGTPNATADVNLQYVNVPDDPTSTGSLVKHTTGLAIGGSSTSQHFYNPYNKFTGPGIFKMSAAPSTEADISAGFDLILVNN